MELIHPFWYIALSAALALLPLAIGLCSSYLKISIVFGMLKSGLGTQQVPSTILVMVLSLTMTVFVMMPVVEKVYLNAQGLEISSLLEKPQAYSLDSVYKIFQPLLSFMRKHSGSREIKALQALVSYESKSENKQVQVTAEVVSLRVLLPAFILTELKEAFSMGFILLLPFLVVDLVVANILVGLGMFMVSPVMISLPIKLLLFVLADGWILLSQGLVRSYGL